MQEMMKDPRWYSALNVVAHAHSDFLTQTGVIIPPPKKVEEMWAVAVMLVGIQESEKKQYWMQPVADSEGTPDVRTITRIERTDDRAPDYTYQDVEVVTYTVASSTETLPEFLLRTKLAPDKAYDDLTTILIWAKDAVKCPPNAEWLAILKSVRQRTPVMLLGKMHSTDPIYSLVQVHPVCKPIMNFNLPETLLKQKYTGVMNLARGTKNKNMRREGEEHCPFESFGINCANLKTTG
jgi:hypothetical protein